MFYHVTSKQAFNQILVDGAILPMVGPRSQSVFEFDPAIYLFCTPEDLLRGMSRWLGDHLLRQETNPDPVVLTIQNPPPGVIRCGWEYVTRECIPMRQFTRIENYFEFEQRYAGLYI